MTATTTNSSLNRAALLALGGAEYQRFIQLIESLSTRDWDRTTECPGWTVRDMVGHVVGAAESQASVRALLSQSRRAARLGKDRPLVDRLNDVQVADHAGRDGDDLVARLRAVAPAAIRGRSRFPRLLRKMGAHDPVSGSMTVGDLMDYVYTRDTWMHRVDICRATDRSLELTPDHDGVLVRHVAEQWADRHGHPVVLKLTGPAGSTTVRGSGGETIEIDAVEFCRMLSGRAEGGGLLEVKVPF